MAETVDPDYAIDWYRIPLPREELAALNERSDFKGWMQAGGHLGLIVGTAGLSLWAFQAQAWIWLAVGLVLHGTVCSFCINAVHELVHGTVFKTRKLNDFFAGVFAFIGWINHQGFWASHAEHHRYTLHTPHDQEVVVPIDIRFKGLWRTVVNPRAAIGHVKHNWRRARGDLFGEWDRKLFDGDPRHKTVMNWARFLLIGHLLTTVVALSSGLWLLPVLISLTPLYGSTLQFFLNSTQHVGLQAHVNDFRLNCRSFHTNPINQFLYWHMNYHIEHHMYAAVPCYNLKKLNKAISHEMPYVWNGLVETWWNIVTCLYRQKHEPGYVFVPKLPGDPDDVDSQASNDASASATTSGQVPVVLSGDADESYSIWECSVCGFIYDENTGLPDQDIAPGTRWDDLPEDWTCPDCGVGKDDFALANAAASVA